MTWNSLLRTTINREPRSHNPLERILDEHSDIIAELDSEIARLTQARTLLSGEGTKAKAVPAKTRRKLSAKARKAIADAQRKRWAKVRKAAK